MTPTDEFRANLWAADLAERYPQVERVYLIGSRGRGVTSGPGPRPDSDWDFIVVVWGGPLAQLVQAGKPVTNTAAAFLLPEVAQEVGNDPEMPCDIMVYDILHPDADHHAIWLTVKHNAPIWKRDPETLMWQGWLSRHA
jgi:predicted nucleotidyltransferase